MQKELPCCMKNGGGLCNKIKSKYYDTACVHPQPCDYYFNEKSIDFDRPYVIITLEKFLPYFTALISVLLAILALITKSNNSNP